MGPSPLPAGYHKVLDGIKERIRTAQIRAALSVNRVLVELYWDIGRSICDRQRNAGWGRSVVVRLARDLPTRLGSALPSVAELEEELGPG